MDGFSVEKARNQMLESQKRNGALLDGAKSPSSGKKQRNFTSLLPFGKKKNAGQGLGSPVLPIFTKEKDTVQSV